MVRSGIGSVHRQGAYRRILGALSGKAGRGTLYRRPQAYRFVSLPAGMDRQLFMNILLGRQFMLYHELATGTTLFVTDDAEARARLEAGMPGLTLRKEPMREFSLRRPRYMATFNAARGDPMELRLPFDDAYSVLNGCGSGIFVSFVPCDSAYLSRAKRKMEELASGIEVRAALNFGARSSQSSGSVHRELYYGSEERKAAVSMLDAMDNAALNNGTSSRVGVILQDGEDAQAQEYVRSKLLVLEERQIDAKDLGGLYAKVRGMDALPVSYADASSMLGFSGSIRRTKAITTRIGLHDGNGGLVFGTYREGSVHDTGMRISTDASTLNLGSLITGLPGSGKTYAAMKLAEQAGKEGAAVVIIAPTREWAGFGADNGIEVVAIDGYGPRINFFRCGDGVSRERFYENLAMLMAHASNAGPYRSYLEKCLLSAFSRIYSGTGNPDPTDVYEEIEEAVIEQHGKRSNVGIRYTKHGENIKAGLESLRLMLMKPQFAYGDGLELENLVRRGAVFDLSMMSNNMKPFFYALILNQVYANADMLDEHGSERLRLLLCMEEAQLIFGNDEQSAATLDLRQRIQDFRKRGIGIMLVTHSATDISLRIRRLCQTKLYFRQSSDSARYAAADMVIDEEGLDDLADRLKTLEHRVCMVNYMECSGGAKSPADSVFVRIPEYSVRSVEETPQRSRDAGRDTVIRIVDKEGNPFAGARFELRYVGERVFAGRTDNSGSATVGRLLEGKRYSLVVFGEKRSETRTVRIVGGGEEQVRL